MHDPFMRVNGPKGRFNGGRLIAILKKMLDRHEALSLVVGEQGGKSYVVGRVGGNRRDEIYLWSGEQPIVLKEGWIEGFEELEDKLRIRGDFVGKVMTLRPYQRNATKGMEAARKVGGQAGWVIDAIEGLKDRCAEDECVWVCAADWNGIPRKLQWIEFNDVTGEVLLVAGRLDLLKKVALRAEKLNDAEAGERKVSSLAQWGEMVDVYIDKKTHGQQQAAANERKGE